jgi:bifunctional non-homologous end joining protein LigD
MSGKLSTYHGKRDFKQIEAIPDSVIAAGRAKPRVQVSSKVEVKAEQAAEKVRVPTGKRKAAAPAATGNVAGVRITHPDRIIDKSSGFTKLDLARYYEQVAQWILPHLAERPVALVRAPDGAQGELFFQKHAEHMKIPGIRRLDRKYDPGHAALMVIDSVEALIGTAQFGTIELHTWNATTRAIEKPDRMIFDLDPGPALKWKTVVEAARLTRSILQDLGLNPLVKTSGGRGVHVVVPLARRNDWDEVGAFSQAVSQHLAATLPDRFSAKMGEKNRLKKVFVDYLRNRRGASTVAAYSARARPGLPVSVPIEWNELDIDSAAQWTIRTLPERMAGMKKDAWASPGKAHTLTAAMKKKLGLR